METVQARTNAALICAFLVLVRLTQCANIFNELDVARYCSDQRSLCQDTGSFIHIVCEYYGKMGSSCSKFNEIPFNDSNENAILLRINKMRFQAANGNAIGKDQQKLPRGYGMKKVFWDSELAAFAKIMINQCISKHRYSCAASKTFTNPMMAYSFANTTTNASEIIDKILSKWEADASKTAPDEILHSPDLKGGESRYYIKMVVGDVTNIGCAAGVYEHEIRPIAIKARDNIRLSGHIVCYLSHYSREGSPVYNTTEPVRGTGWTRCGCPPKYRETKYCLCVPSPTEQTLKRQTTTVAITTKLMITTSTQAYYDDLDKYMQQIDNLVSPGAKTQLLDLATGKQQNTIKQPELDSPQQKLEWSPQVSLAPKMQQMLEPKIEQKLKEIQSAPKGVRKPGSTCSGGGRSKPKIVMLPILTIQNARSKHLSRRRGRGYYRRSANTSSVPKSKAKDDISFSDDSIDELPKNMSIGSKVLETMAKIRNKQAADIFSNENAEHGQPTIEPIYSVETDKQTIKPFQTTNNISQDPENSKTVLNILELLEEEGNVVEPLQSTAEPSRPVTSKITRVDRNERAKKRVMRLLDLLEEKGEKAQLSSREIVEFDTKMRRIYMRVIGTPRTPFGGGN